MRLLLALISALAASPALAGGYPSPTFAGVTLTGCQGYLFGNSTSPVSCIPPAPSGGLYPVGTSGAVLGLLSTNNYISGSWTFSAPQTFAAATFGGLVTFNGDVGFYGTHPGKLNYYSMAAGNLSGGASAYDPANGAPLNLYNTFYGVSAGWSADSVQENSGFGHNALNAARTPGTLGNSAFGDNSLANTNGSNAAFNSALGSNAGRCVTTVMGNIFVGHGAGGQDDTSQAACTGSDTTAVGSWSGQELSTGGGNSFYGMNSGLNVSTGAQNVYLGLGAGACTSSNTATAAGCDASYNVAAGYDAGQVFSGTGLVAIGWWSAKSLTTGSRDTFGGYQSGGATVTDSDLTGWGFNTLGSVNGGVSDSALGSMTLHNATTGSYDNGVGAYALASVTTGSWNQGFGFQAGFGATTANRGIYIGNQAGLSGNFSDVIVIGNGINAAADHSIVIGDNLMSAFKLGPATGVSCAAGTVNLSTLIVTIGIVTHC